MNLQKFSKEEEYMQYLKFRDPPGYTFAWTADKENVWVPDNQGSFEHAIVKRKDAKFYVVEVQSSKNEKTFPIADVHHMNNRQFDGREDCSDLPHLSLASVLHNLHVRYESKAYQTYSGLFLVVINPWARYPIYGREVMELYSTKKKREDAPPHVFACAEYAYQCLLEKEDQSMLITGESGAGKTENTKKVIQYLAYRAGVSKKVQGGSGDLEKGSLDAKIVSANPLLEALGNAKTLRNHNSSRFGKFIKITFSKSKISGASITSYLLERSRVVMRGVGERNFHVFYQMLLGMDPVKKASYFLTTPDQYTYLNPRGTGNPEKTYTDPDVDDKDEHKQMIDAATTLGFSEPELETIFKVVAAVLHLGNVRFTGEEASVENPEILREYVAPLLGVNGDKLCTALCHPTLTLPGQKPVQRNLTVKQASASRDAFAKALYGRMFLWVVQKVNQSLVERLNQNFIGILDIAGFEFFEVNGFDQLCINFTNERLQQFFNHYMFDSEQEVYRVENIVW
jgi:myosin protein heavy chain